MSDQNSWICMYICLWLLECMHLWRDRWIVHIVRGCVTLKSPIFIDRLAWFCPVFTNSSQSISGSSRLSISPLIADTTVNAWALNLLFSGNWSIGVSANPLNSFWYSGNMVKKLKSKMWNSIALSVWMQLTDSEWWQIAVSQWHRRRVVLQFDT